MASARELGVHFIAAGHYATETFGVKALGEHLAERFGLSTSSSTCPTRSERAAIRAQRRASRISRPKLHPGSNI